MRDFKVAKVTVVKTGTEYTPDELGTKTIKDVIVTVNIVDEGTVVGETTTTGWVENGDVTFIQPDPLTSVYSEVRAKAPEDPVKTPVAVEEPVDDKLPEK